jgi:hypothetical protein
MSPTWSHPSRGSGTLALLLVMLLASTMMLLYLNRALIFEQRAAALQWRATQAFEAAEAGRHWALALLNHDRAIDASCAPVSIGNAGGMPRSLRERLLDRDASSNGWRPSAMQPACALGTDTSLACACPAGAAARPPLPSGSVEAAVFSVVLRAGPQAGGYLLETHGCVGIRASQQTACDDPSHADAHALVRVALATLPGAPAGTSATLVAAGGVTLAGAVSVINSNAEHGGLAVDSGGAVQTDAAVRLLGPPGSANGAFAPIITGNPRWAGGSADAVFSAHFGNSRSRHASLPSLTRPDCSAGCNAAVVDTALAGGARALWIAGDLDASAAAVSWGSAERPILLIVQGRITLSGPAQLHGLLYTRELVWTNLDSAAGLLRGAVVSESSVALNGAMTLRYDAEILARSAQAGAVYAAVPGSWRDFAD